MSVLLIDNGTTLLEKLKKLIPGEEIIKKWDEFDGNVMDYQVAILSGGSIVELVGNEKEFSKEIEFIQKAQIPIIGICFGCELITLAFGGTLTKLESQHKGIREIQLTKKLKYFEQNSTIIKVFENHHFIIDKVPDSFDVIARSSDGPEAIKHKQRAMYGLQFHPENFVDQTEGDKFFLNLLQDIKDRLEM